MPACSSRRIGFNPRPHAAGDHVRRRLRPPVTSVSIHARTRRATRCSAARGMRSCCFNPRPHAAGDQRPARSTLACHAFQSTPARGGRRRRPRIRCDSSDRFNPRPHAAGDAARCTRSAARRMVSIHARTRRATHADRSRGSCRYVSIHARTRRATADRMPSTATVRSFQSTPARGGRLAEPDSTIPNRAMFQSTPARGGRPGIIGATCDVDARFNPRPHAAGDSRLSCQSSPSQMFQSTPARGGRRSRCQHGARSQSFQSTPARGGRPSARDRPWLFQSTPARGGRRSSQHGCRWCFNPRPHAAGDLARSASSNAETMVSIHARTRRATPQSRPRRCAAIRVSIHARTRRATVDGTRPYRELTCFNPRPHAAGDDHARRAMPSMHASFNPRPHAAGDVDRP